MYIIDRETKKISPLSKNSFKQLGFKEREDLQEWIANEPNVLGEDLLIIQKEFDGFDETKERLDLLALDKNGNLVIIENKLDDSGRDVVWQSIKYASYCASLKNQNIVQIYKDYLNKYKRKYDENNQLVPVDAEAEICEFLGAADLEEVTLNQGTSQRIILIAANFRKEVTSTALWLLNQGIDIKCFKVELYTLDYQIFFDIEQIIPTPEAQELMISITAKQIEEKNIDNVQKSRHEIRQQYWSRLLDVFKSSSLSLYNNISPSKDHWLNAGSGHSGCSFGLIFLQKAIRIELGISRSNQAENKMIYDVIYQYRDSIEQDFGHKLEWMRLDDKKMSRIEYEKEVDGLDKENWEQYILWHLENMTKFSKILKPYLDKSIQNLP
ncbi:DUF4268 domain-containing protein [Acinetobacter sp. ANC 4640]